MTFPERSAALRPARWLVLAAFAAIYLIWGSTYVAIHFAVETIPPFVASSIRFLLAGLVMFVWARAQGARMPARLHWREAAVCGFLMFLLNNGALVWASQFVPSGMASLLIAATPIWIVLLDWWRPTLHGRQEGGQRPSLLVFFGLILGFFGVILLVSPGDFAAGGRDFAIGVAAILIGTVAWAAGTQYARQATLHDSPIMTTAMQLLTGGLMLLALGLVTGEFARFDPTAVSTRSLISWVYLGVAGSIIGFGSYSWLLRVSNPARVATYAYVNPVVAVFLGWLLASEPITLRTIIAAVVIIGAVMLINGARHRRPIPRLTPLAEAVSETGA